MVEWSCTKKRLNERGSYIFVEWSCANQWGLLYLVEGSCILLRLKSSPSKFYGHLARLLATSFYCYLKMMTWGQSKISSYCFCVFAWIKRIRRQGAFRIPLCNPSAEKLRQAESYLEFVKDKQRSSSTKTVNRTEHSTDRFC